MNLVNAPSFSFSCIIVFKWGITLFFISVAQPHKALNWILKASTLTRTETSHSTYSLGLLMPVPPFLKVTGSAPVHWSFMGTINSTLPIITVYCAATNDHKLTILQFCRWEVWNQFHGVKFMVSAGSRGESAPCFFQLLVCSIPWLLATSLPPLLVSSYFFLLLWSSSHRHFCDYIRPTWIN